VVNGASAYISPDTGWSVLAGAIRKTLNGGALWTLETSGTTNQLSSIYFSDALRGWACAYNNNTNASGVVLATTDGGGTWAPQDIGTSAGTLYRIAFLGKDTGWVMGRGGWILYSANGGGAWTTLDRVTDKGLRDFQFTGPNSGWAVGDEGTVLKYDGTATSLFPKPAGRASSASRAMMRPSAFSVLYRGVERLLTGRAFSH
jgi:photosystem II stability/assembly factor-like uncharacterized protein